jgi:[ribosomal protein S5]-alanine N-acetyltransferase
MSVFRTVQISISNILSIMLETTRLKLVPLTHEQMLLYKNNTEALAKTLGTYYLERQNDPSVANDLSEALEFWIAGTKNHPENFEWFTTWEIILKSENIAVGGIGFSGLPNEEGKSMTGYGLDMRYYGKGIATEALQAMILWGFKNPDLKTIIADTPLLHKASQRVLIKNNFIEDSRDENLAHWSLSR